MGRALPLPGLLARLRGGKIAFGPGEAPAAHLADPADDEKCLWVNGMDQALHLPQFRGGDDGEEHLGLPQHIARAALQKGPAPVHPGEHGPADLLHLFADHLDLHLLLPQYQRLIEHRRINENQQNPVQNLFPVAEKRLEEQDDHIKPVEHGRHRKVKQAVEHQGRDVHAARRRSGSDDDPQARADTHSPKGGAKDHVLCDRLRRQHALPQLQKDGIEQVLGWLNDFDALISTVREEFAD